MFVIGGDENALCFMILPLYRQVSRNEPTLMPPHRFGLLDSNSRIGSGIRI
jgi:hypothetical protein